MSGAPYLAHKDLAQCINSSRRAVIFTGAGISTESGIPDFRSPGGIWSRMQPIEFQDYVSDREARRVSWQRRLEMEETWKTVEPNDGHRAVADMVARGKVSHVITQNIDALHQASGVPGDQVIELHGNTRHAKCLDCGTGAEIAAILAHFRAHGEAPDCPACGGLIKTATISFGQPMPEAEMARARAASLACDLMLVLGSSLVVYPAAGFPLMAKRNGARLAIVNRDETPQDQIADLVIRGEISPTLRAVIDRFGDGLARTHIIARLNESLAIRRPALRRADEEEDDKEDKSPRPDPQSAEIAKALFKSRTVLVFGEVDMKMAERVTAQLLAYAESEGDIRVIVNSPGGHVESGDTIHDMIRFVGNRVKVIGTGWVASAGAHIFLGAKRDNRYCLPFTRFLLHQPLGGVRGQASDITIEAEEILKMRARLIKEIAVETGQPYEKVVADTERNFWMGAEEAVKYGLVGKVVSSANEV